ncbi:polysaccharide pyruvyl transferase family protein [Novosphingobium sp.]|uniref:polysaccharide pyruvyl transferase family protein n=1 Tax=Novosphingobium sp. TaxID=1874826 RepID=UPI002FDE03FE
MCPAATMLDRLYHDGGAPRPAERRASAPAVAARAPLRIALLNVKFSPNLGDGLLAECLERELAQALGNGAQVYSIDIAARKKWLPAGTGSLRATLRQCALAVLERLPPGLRRFCAGLTLRTLSVLVLRPHFRRQLAHCDAAVIGGGNLFTDADLNFPVKLDAAVRAVARHRIPLAVHAVGAGADWSAQGRRLLARAATRVPLVHATVRDERSRRAWQAQLVADGAAGATLAGDPGLVAARHYPQAPPSSPTVSGRPHVGLCITAPLALRYHVGQHHPGQHMKAKHSAEEADTALCGWYGNVARTLAETGMDVVLFTNGSPEDQSCLQRNVEGWMANGNAAYRNAAPRGWVSMAAPFSAPADLAAFVSGCDLVIAHRMHACIAAHAFGVPTIGLTWDEKLASFFDLAGRARFAVNGTTCAPAAMAGLAQQALAEGVDAARHAALIASTRADITLLAERLRAACANT